MKRCSLYFLSALLTVAALLPVAVSAQRVFVSTVGNDRNEGSERKPVATFARAQQLARTFDADTDVEVIFADGVYYLPENITFGRQDSHNYPSTVTYKALNEGKVVISGGKRLFLKWNECGDGIFAAKVDEDQIDQLFINGKRQRMARFPNAVEGEGRNVYDTWVLEHKTEANPDQDPLNPERVARWGNPEGAFLHTMHSYLWGDMHYVVKGKNEDGTLKLEGGWQNNRPSTMHPLYRMIENVKEELDAAQEWYYDKSAKTLYYMPETDVDLRNATVEVVRLKNLFEFNGSGEECVKGICLKGFVLRHSTRMFMENRERLLRSDWTLYRGGAITFDGAENCTIENCEFDQVGGNTIVVSNRNRNITVKGCYIHNSGASGVVFAGNPQAVHNPLFEYVAQDYANIDLRRGALNDDYPCECRVEDCIITMTGRDEKQTAPVQISMSYRITVDHCSVYDVPRAGININEGTFGGHIIENCDLFNTVLETGDHGSFNSWGRDRFWTTDVAAMSAQVSGNPQLPYLDILEPNIIRNNRFSCDHGWAIDLDDGSSFYCIYNNVLLVGGLKLREGYNRIVTNNIIINNSLHPHVWPKESGDVFCHNIVFGAYRPVAMTRAMKSDDKWGSALDYNLFVADSAQVGQFAANGADAHSLSGDPQFADASAGDFRVADSSPALRIGFVNFDTNHFGVLSSRLKAIAKSPDIPAIRVEVGGNEGLSHTMIYLGAQLRVPTDEELSAYGVRFDRSGIAFESVPAESEAARKGFRSGDLIVSINGVRIGSFDDLDRYRGSEEGAAAKQIFVIVRNQNEMTLETIILK